MTRLFTLLLSCMLFLCPLALAEQNAAYIGVWIETEGYGTLTVLSDGTARMDYYDGTVTECHWALTDTAAKFTDGMWYGSPMELLDENTLSVSNGWMVFAREGFLPTTDEALLLGAEPVGEEGDPFLGSWELTKLITDGEEIDPALFGMTMTITFFDTGLVTTDDGLEPYTATWFVSYGNAMVEGDVLVLDENDQLICSTIDGTMVFTRVLTAETDPANPVEEETDDDLSDMDELLALLQLLEMMETSDNGLSALPEHHQGFVGEWQLCYVMTGGLTGDLRPLGVTGTLTLNADYTGLITGIADEEAGWYEDEEGVIRFGENGMPMFLLGEAESETDLFLQYGTEAGGCMIFHQDAEAVWTPDLYPLQTPAVSAEPPAAIAGGTLLTDVKYRCTSYTTSGFTLDAATLGAEYAVIFRADGTVAFTLAGIDLPDLPYLIADGQYIIDYFGTDFTCTPTEAGFDMDYYSTMLMHFVPAE